MEFDLIDIEVKSLHLTKETQAKDKKPQYQLNLQSTMDFNKHDSRSFRLNVSTVMTGNNGFDLQVEQIFYFIFKKDVTLEKAQEIILAASTESIIYPYVRTYIVNLLTMSGFPQVHIPLMLFNK
ncbi:protein-export chaperone SecB [Serratia fonticola]|uniref:protein-export chaperone SecB n=1 Tax=Serratia fonticola TaxID=47917 RepID=UPI0027F47227|nr:protein-export chaperone SecB [Serratia fonticola]MDQ7208526.1 protein-export chaperone SecB [Serratia fonticola]HBE9083095.1 protein-export chaperone SecB [Serratia fonticola]HBE9091273.1 protein-export chaperone SecB [Serratia fonticola]HBE9151654.1 protein-export chaperone SecB [Serratia fonticola]